MTEILLLGTFHFMESSFDFYTDKVQDELDDLTKKLLEFHPDTVAVEAAIHQQEAVSESYQKFNLKDLKNPEKMRSETLGNIHMFGQTYPITYNNEAIQIGYKLGKLLNLDDIYAIDEDIDLGESATKLMPFLTDTINELNKNRELVNKTFEDKSNFLFITSNQLKSPLKKIEEISYTYLDYSYKNFQVLAPMYKTLNGIDNINNKLHICFYLKKAYN